VVDDITFTNNIVKNVASGFTTLAKDDQCKPANGCTNPGEMKRVVIDNNLILLGATSQPGYEAGYGKSLVWGALINWGLVDFVFQHNTIVPPPDMGYCTNSLYFEMSGSGPATPPVSRSTNLWVLDNVLCRQIWGPFGHIGETPYVFTDYMGDPAPPEPRLMGNVFYAPKGDKAFQLPPHNFVSTVPFTYVNPSSGNYQLSVPTWTDTSDGRISGVDSSAVSAAIRPNAPSTGKGSGVGSPPPPLPAIPTTPRK